MKTKAEFEILSLEDPLFAEKFAKLVGISPGDAVEIHGPQFERTDGITPIENPSDVFNILHALPQKTLIALGMGNWDGRLWMFPYQWFHKIPHGYPVECIYGEKLKWDVNKCDDDYRAGMLAYGIVPNFARQPQ